MTSIERTAYPRFKRLTTAGVLRVFFTPTEEEIAWARERTRETVALFALVLDLKCFQKEAETTATRHAGVPRPRPRHCYRRCGAAVTTEGPGNSSVTASMMISSQVAPSQYPQRRNRPTGLNPAPS